jgi:hypothetical protein
MTTLRKSRQQAEDIINSRVEAANSLVLEADDVRNEETFDAWNSSRKRWVGATQTALRSLFDDDGDNSLRFQSATAPNVVLMAGDLDQEFGEDLRGVKSGITHLLTTRDSLEFMDLAPGTPEVTSVEPSGPASDAQIFIVHGHDEALREKVAGVLRQTGPNEVVILHEQPDGGQTVIEKLEKHGAASGFAAILMTADDVGGNSDADLSPRARQNVVFEHGYFVGLLGRGNVAVLYDPQIEKPSDLEGLVYIDISEGTDWRLKLLRELRSVGFKHDSNKLN